MSRGGVRRARRRPGGTGAGPLGAEPWVRVETLSYRIGESQLLNHVSFTAGSGELLALVGPNGAGKSTILALLSGDLHPTEGRITLFGAEPQDWRPLHLARLRSVMTQHNSQAFSFTVEEMVRMGRAPYPASDDDPRIIRAALEAGEITHLSARDTTTLSGGEIARTVFARVVAQDARIVLLDEPTAPLDLKHQEKLLAHARSMTAAGACVIVVLHDLSLAARHCDSIAIFNRGELEAMGPPHEVLTAERIARVYGQEVEIIPHPRSGRPLVVPV